MRITTSRVKGGNGLYKTSKIDSKTLLIVAFRSFLPISFKFIPAPLHQSPFYALYPVAPTAFAGTWTRKPARFSFGCVMESPWLWRGLLGRPIYVHFRVSLACVASVSRLKCGAPRQCFALRIYVFDRLITRDMFRYVITLEKESPFLRA